ncbi:MAG: hypothetical protein AAFR94_07465, partial [Pseudomonadota bacterium]
MKIRFLPFVAAMTLAVAVLAACSRGASEAEPPIQAVGTDAISAADDRLPMPLPSGTTAAITASDLALRTQLLADDAFEGRGPSAPIGEKAADWIAAEMERIGLQPGGDNGGWFQTVGMVEQTIDEANSALSFSGGLSERDFPTRLGL